MGSETANYQTRSVPVSAFQFFQDTKPWPWPVTMHSWCVGPGDREEDLPSVELEYGGGWMSLREGDWVVIYSGIPRRLEVFGDADFKARFEPRRTATAAEPPHCICGSPHHDTADHERMAGGPADQRTARLDLFQLHDLLYRAGWTGFHPDDYDPTSEDLIRLVELAIEADRASRPAASSTPGSRPDAFPSRGDVPRLR